MLVRQVAAGKDRLTAKSREEAEKALRQIHIGAGADPMHNAADFNSTAAKDYFKTIKKGQEEPKGYYHWDEEMVLNKNLAKAQQLYPNAFLPTNGYCLKNHDPFTDVDAFVPHLQIHEPKEDVVKIYFP